MRAVALACAVLRSPGSLSASRFNDFIRDDPRLIAVVLPVRDGVTVIRRKI